MKKLLPLFVFLAACVAEAPQNATTDASGAVTEKQTPGNVARLYEANRVGPAVQAFSSVCLARDNTVNKAAAAAKALGVGLTAPTQYSVGGSPAIDLRARRSGEPINDRDQTFDWIVCAINFKGTWADTIRSDVEADLKKAGFKVSGLKRTAQSPAGAFNGGQVVSYTGTVSRDGRSYSFELYHTPRGAGTEKGRVSIEYVSRTGITIASPD
jgi:hypothetical protein